MVDDTEFVKRFPFIDLSTKVKYENLAAVLYTSGYDA